MTFLCLPRPISNSLIIARNGVSNTLTAIGKMAESSSAQYSFWKTVSKLIEAREVFTGKEVLLAGRGNVLGILDGIDLMEAAASIGQLAKGSRGDHCKIFEKVQRSGNWQETAKEVCDLIANLGVKAATIGGVPLTLDSWDIIDIGAWAAKAETLPVLGYAVRVVSLTDVVCSFAIAAYSAQAAKAAIDAWQAKEVSVRLLALVGVASNATIVAVQVLFMMEVGGKCVAVAGVVGYGLSLGSHFYKAYQTADKDEKSKKA